MKSRNNSLKNFTPPRLAHSRILIFAVFGVLVLSSRPVSQGVVSALSYVGEVLIPAVFPFAVLSGIYGKMQCDTRDSLLSKGIARGLRLSPISLSALMLGIFAGFPLGGKYASDLYNDNRISKEEATRLFPMVNNPSLAFVIAGVGSGMLKSARAGLLLYSAVVLSAYLVGCIGAYAPPPNTHTTPESHETHNLSALIREATLTTVYVCGYVIFFSATTSAICSHLPSGALRLSVMLVCEVTGACRYAATLGAPMLLRMSAIGFALGFGGVCVGMQSEGYLRVCGLSVGSYYKRKLVQGVLCAFFSCLFTVLFL